MIRVLASSAAIALCAHSVAAGGIERTNQSVGVIFETGNYAEFSFASVNPEVSGTGALITPGASSGDMADNYGLFGAALKMNLSDKLDVALIFDQPFGANVAYPFSPYFAGSAGPSTAVLKATATTAIAKYRFNENFSAYGGLRYQSMQADISIPFLGFYSASGERSGAFGYLAGVAYERPDIALRVALTYNSAIKHELGTTEASFVPPSVPLSSDTTIETPQSINLEAQTGIAADTLLFGSVRWVEWSKFDISPSHYTTDISGGTPLVSYADDVFTYTLGVGRRLNENWSIAGSVAYEKQNGGFQSNLSPTDGKTTLGVGATYTLDNMKLQTGVSYTWIGDAETRLGLAAPAGSFSGNTAIAFGMKVGFSF